MTTAAPPATGIEALLLAMADDEFVIGFSDLLLLSPTISLTSRNWRRLRRNMSVIACCWIFTASAKVSAIRRRRSAPSPMFAILAGATTVCASASGAFSI